MFSGEVFRDQKKRDNEKNRKTQIFPPLEMLFRTGLIKWFFTKIIYLGLKKNQKSVTFDTKYLGTSTFPSQNH